MLRTPAAFNNVPMPPTAQLLGWTLVALDQHAGRFSFTNPSGFVQGRMIAAILGVALGPAAVAMVVGKTIATTIDLQVHFPGPLRPGPVTAMAKVVSMGKTIAFLREDLFDTSGRLSVTTAAGAMLTDFHLG